MISDSEKKKKEKENFKKWGAFFFLSILPLVTMYVILANTSENLHWAR